MSTFSSRTKSLREENGMSQEDLAKVLNCSRTAISGYESGRNEPSYKILQNISDYFTVSIDYLLGRSNQLNGLGGKLPTANELLNENNANLRFTPEIES